MIKSEEVSHEISKKTIKIIFVKRIKIMKKTYKSHIKTYLIVWAISVLIILFYANLILYYFIFTNVLLMLVNFYEGRRLTNYLKDNYKDEYKFIKSFGEIQGVHNSFNTLSFIFSDDDYNDENLDFLKSNYKKMILLVFSVFFSYPIMFFFFLLFYY